MIGPTTLDGLILATGHHRNGVLLAPITADAVATLLLGGEPSPELAPFRHREVPAVTLLVNGAEEPLDGSTSVADLVDRLGCGRAGRGGRRQRRRRAPIQWSEHRLHDGDRVEVLRVAQGG